LNLRTGNPALRPEIANLFEMNYHRGGDEISIDITLYRRETSDAISPIIQPYGNNQSIEIPVNFFKQTNQGLEGQLEYRANDFFKATASLVVGQVEFSDPDTQITFNKNSTWSARLRQQFKLAKNWKIEFSETYRAPRFSAQRKSYENFYVNFALNKKFNNKRGSIALSCRDIFNTRQFGYSLQTQKFELERIEKWQTRRVTLGLRYYIFEGK